MGWWSSTLPDAGLVLYPLIISLHHFQRNSAALGDVPPVPDWMADLAQQAGMSDSAKEASERDARWIGEFADQLTMAIALREWDTAVDLVEQGTSSCYLLSAPILINQQGKGNSPPCRTCRQSLRR
jgi:hypothetical protein